LREGKIEGEKQYLGMKGKSGFQRKPVFTPSEKA